MKSQKDIQPAEQTSLFTKGGYLHGGRRKGAGRPKTSDKRTYSLWCTAAEYEKVKAYLEAIRKEDTKCQ